MKVAVYVRRAVVYVQPNRRCPLRMVIADWDMKSSQLPASRLVRHWFLSARPRANIGAQVGTVTAMMSPFFTESALFMANWVVVPKNGDVLMSWLCPTTERKSRWPVTLRSAVRRTREDPPSMPFGRLICASEQLPSDSVKATTRPSLGAVTGPFALPDWTW